MWPLQRAIAGACFAAGGGHGDQLAISREFEHRIGIGLANQLELIGVEPQLPGQLQRLQDWRWALSLSCQRYGPTAR